MGNTQQLYGRLDMVMLDRHDKIYGSLGMHDSYLLNTVTGNPLTLTNSREGKMDDEVTDCKIYGWSKQETTTGKNLINADEYYSQFKQSDGTYKLKTVILNNIRISLSEFVGKEITLSVKLTVGANTSAVFLMYISSEQKKIIGSTIKSGLTGKSILTVTPVSNTDYFVISFGSGNDDVTFSELQLELGSVATSYEPYTGGNPSPSPEYPQEIISAGTGSTNLFDKDSISVNYVIEGDGKLVLSTGYDSSDFIPVSSGTYTITATGSVRCKTYDKDKKPFTINTYTDINISNGGTFKIAENVKYIRFSMYHPNADTIMLNRGSTALPYEAYKSGIIDITVHGKNLFDFSRLVSDGVNVMDYDNQTITVPARTNNTGYNQTLRDLCPGITPGTYVFSMKCSNPECIFGSYFLEAVKDFPVNKPVEITDELLDNHIAWYNNPDSEVENVISEIQIEKGNAVTSYEPYHEPQSLSIQTPTGLPAIPVDTGGNYTDANGQQWIADYIDLKRGKYVQRVWQAEFNGSERWDVYSDKGFRLEKILPEKMANREALCNQLRRKKVGIYSNVIITGAFDGNSTIYIDNCTLRDNTLADKGLSNWKAHLTKHPLVVMTYLDEPIERDLTLEEIEAYKNLVTYAGTTIVENDADCYMECTYKASGN